MNDQRWFVSLIRDICQEQGIAITDYCEGWVFQLQKGDLKTHLFGYDFSLNSAVAKMLCRDKAAMSELLDKNGVPCVEHRIFHGPDLQGHVKMLGNWERMLQYLKANPDGVVCKPNEGTGGVGVILARSVPELEAAVYETFKTNRSLCLSAFEKFEDEIRIGLLNQEVQLVYRKVRPSITGDGVHTVGELLLAQKRYSQLAAIAPASIGSIPNKNEIVILNWRHNLGQGAKAELITQDEAAEVWTAVTRLAKQATEVLGVRLASVDVVKTTQGWKVLEVNSGIMMENLVQTHPDGQALARNFYSKILSRLFQTAPEVRALI